MISLGEFELVDDSAFDDLNKVVEVDDLPHNHCPDCNIAMIFSHSEYCCPQCHRVETHTELFKEREDISTGVVRISTGSHKGKFYNISSDYSKTQKKCIYDQLVRNHMNFQGNAFPLTVLSAVAERYNNIQKFITEDDIDSEGNIRGQKKFVRRGSIKDEVLAGLIHFECIREGLVRKKKDIAEFMKLPTSGFSRGEDILRNLHAEDKVDIPVDDEPLEGFIDRYLEALEIDDDPRYSAFIVDIVNASERSRIGMSSQISSKIVGALWIIICRCKLNISVAELERAADNTKKNTFIKFYKDVTSRPRVFLPIFKKHGIAFK